MSVRKRAHKVLPVFAYFSPYKELLDSFEKLVKKKYGNILQVSEEYESSIFTDYYTTEMGFPLYKRLVSLKSPISIENVYNIKLWAYKIEKHFSKNNKRLLNIDPGFIQLENFILLTGKRFSHRIHIRSQVYADLTLIYNSKEKSYTFLPWTYPDYKNKNIIDFLIKAREYLHINFK